MKFQVQNQRILWFPKRKIEAKHYVRFGAIIIELQNHLPWKIASLCLKYRRISSRHCRQERYSQPDCLLDTNESSLASRKRKKKKTLESGTPFGGQWPRRSLSKNPSRSGLLSSYFKTTQEIAISSDQRYRHVDSYRYYTKCQKGSREACGKHKSADSMKKAAIY